MRTWKQSLREAIQANPRLSGTLALQFGFLLYATLKARQGRSANMPPVEDVIEALPKIGAAALAAPLLAPPKKSRRRRSSR